MVLLLIAFTLFIIWKLLKSKKGLLIDNNGIKDYSNILHTNKYLWKDIKAIKTTIDLKDEIILIKLKNPATYLNKVTNKYGLKLLQKIKNTLTPIL